MNLKEKEMYDSQGHSFCSEFYTIEKSIEVVVNINGEDVQIRIDALGNGVDGSYSTRAYIGKHVTLQPTYPQANSKHDQPPSDFLVWVNYSLPWINRDSANAALSQTLGFLSERCSG